MVKRVLTLMMTAVLLFGMACSQTGPEPEQTPLSLNSGSQDDLYADIEMLREKRESITGLTEVEYGEGGRTETDRSGQIDRYAEMILSMEIGEETDIITVDRETYYVFAMKDGSSLEFGFNGGNYIKNGHIYLLNKAS